MAIEAPRASFGGSGETRLRSMVEDAPEDETDPEPEEGADLPDEEPFDDADLSDEIPFEDDAADMETEPA